MLVAAGAALSLTENASASIIYTAGPGSVVFTNSNPVLTIVLPGGGANLKFQGYFLHSTTLLRPPGGTGDVGGIKAIEGNFKLNASSGVQRLGPNTPVAGPFVNASHVSFFQAPLHVQSGGNEFGTFPVNSQNYFAGFQITSTGANGYNGDLGYIELAVGSTGGNDPTYPNELNVVGYAYNTGGGPIFTGELPPAAPVPEAKNTATALLLLACAGGSLTTWRRRKQATA